MKQLYSAKIAETLLKLPFNKTFKIFNPKRPKGIIYSTSGRRTTWKQK